MTLKEIQEINIKVAEIIRISVVREGLAVYRHANILRTIWSPSTDWNDAMFAADKAKLFHVDIWRHVLVQHSDGWCTHNLDGDITNETSKAETGPLAICQAILALFPMTIGAESDRRQVTPARRF